MRRPVELIMFDLDGTIADTGGDLADSVNFTRGRFDLAPLPEQSVYAHVGRGIEHLLKHALPELKEESFEEIRRVFLEHYERHLLDKTVLYPDVRGVLEHFRGKRRVVVSNKIRRLTEAVVRGLGLGDMFDAVLGGDSASEKKPHPALLLMSLRRFGIAAPSAVMVGDGDTDIEAGKRAGVMTCGVTYGLGDRKQLIAAGPDVLIERLAELPEYFY
jgi:phosphoglycolate phosphatase